MAKPVISSEKKNPVKKKTVPAASLNTTSSEIPVKWLVLLLCCTFAAYLPALSNALVNWDDYAYIRDNPVIKTLSLSGIKTIFNPNTFVVGNYHPLTVLSYALEYKFAEARPFIYHLDNILLHLANICLFFVFIKRLSKIPMAAFIAACLFALHPMRVESVAWAAERKDVLYMFFFLVSTLFYLNYKDKNKLSWLYLSILAFVFSILSKGQAVVLPLTLLLIDYFRGEKIRETLKDKVPYFVLSVISGLEAMAAQHASLTSQRMQQHTFFERGIYACYGFFEYLVKFLIPVNLRCFYRYPDEIPFYYYSIPLVLIGAAYLVWKYKNKWLLFGSLYFVFTISIVLQLLPVGDAIMADRYTYVPYMGLFLLTGYYSAQYLEKKPMYTQTLLVLLVFLLGILTWNRASDWKDSKTLWTDVIKKDPATSVAYNDLGVTELENKNFELALSHFQNAVKYKPLNFEAYNNMGNTLGKLKRHAEEIQCYKESVRIAPAYTTAWFNCGISHADAGEFKEALENYDQVLKYEPGNVQAWYSKGIAWRGCGNDSMAIECYNKALKLNPSFIEAYNNRGNIHFRQGAYDSAIEDYNHTLSIDPHNGNAWYNRAAAWYNKKEYQKAYDDAVTAKNNGYNTDPQFLAVLQNAINHK